MSSPLESDSAELRAVQQLVGGIMGEMRQEFGRLSERGDGLTGGWAGASGSKYRPPWDEWKHGGKTIMDAVEAGAALLGGAAAAYDHREGENTSSLADTSVPEIRVNF